MICKDILIAFSINGVIEELLGGQQNSYKIGNIVLKKNDGDNLNYEYIADILNEIRNVRYRITRPIKSIYGTYVYKGFIALIYEEGEHDSKRYDDIIDISLELANDLEQFDISRIYQSNTKWAIAMDILFRKREFPDYVNVEHKEICLSMINGLKSLPDKLQIIHGDLGGNVLFHKYLKPCVIDFSPLIAPKKMQEAIIVADAMAWGNKNKEILEKLPNKNEYLIYIKYAIIFRIITAACSIGVSRNDFEVEYQHYIQVWNSINNL